MKKCGLIMLFVMNSFLSIGQESPENIIEKFFNLYKNNTTEALNSIFITNKFFSKEQTNEVAKKLNDFVKMVGEYHGNEFIQKETVGNNFVLYTYIARYDRQPLKLTFIFYKPNETWVLYNFKFGSNLDEELENAAKINLLIKP